MAINGVENTPLLPSYYDTNNTYYNVNYGRRLSRKKTTRRRKSSFGQKDAKILAKKMKLKVTSGGKQLSFRQLISRIGASLKSKKDKETKTKAVQSVAKKMKVPLTSSGRKRSLTSLWSEIRKAVDTNKVTKKNKSIRKTKSSTKIRMGRHRRRSQNFGSWWDNTQKTYCLGGQCSYSSDVGSGYPYIGDWPPYASIKGSSFGNSRLPYDLNSVIMDTPSVAPVIPGLITNRGTFPDAVSSPFPFVNTQFN